MSVGDEIVECPLCMEQLEMDDLNFFPCTCGYQICRFCWHRIRTDENGLCPACRKQYSEDPAEFKPLTDDELQRIKKERKQKDLQRKQKAAENRKHLANVRVVQKNLVFVVGLSTRLADPEVLKKHEYFGKFGKIHKVVINQSTSYAGSQGPSASAYVTYHKMEDALRTIQAVNNVYVDGRTLKASLGTTKYCSHFLKGTQCMKSDCMYLHELGEQCASFTKEEMQQGRHQEYEQKLHENFLNSQNVANHSAGLATTTTPNKVSSSQSQPVATNRKKTSSPTEDSQQQQLQQQNSPPTTNHLQHSSNKEAWPSLQSKPDKITNGTKHSSSTPPPTAKSETLHNRAPGNHRGNAHMNNGPQSIPSSKAAAPTEPKTQPVQSQAAVPPVIGSSRKHLFGDPVNADSLFGSSGFPTHRNPNKPNVVPMVPAPQTTELSLPSTEIPDTMPVSSSTDWQAAFGFGSSAQTTTSNDDDLGFDPWDESSKALADLIEKETLINPFSYPPQRHPPGFQLPPMPTFNPSQLKTEPVGTSKMLGLMQYTQAGDMPQAAPPNGSFRDLLSSSTAVPRSSPSLSGAPAVQSDSFNMKDWQDGLKALLPNINISFGAAPTPSQPLHQHGTHNGWSNSNTPDWLAQDPAIVTSGNITDGNSQRSESPPHWMRSLQQLTENDSSTTLSSTTNHRLPFVQQFQFRGAGWPTQSQTPPPGFSAPLRPGPQTTEPQIAQGLK